jgi:hypothetical protein
MKLINEFKYLRHVPLVAGHFAAPIQRDSPISYSSAGMSGK